MIRKRFHLHWIYECPDAVLTCSVMKCKNKSYLIFGGHDKILYLMDPKDNMKIVDKMNFDGWVRCSYTIDLDEDGCDEALIGSGDGNFIVIRFDPKSKKFVGVMRYSSSGKVICCVAGDLTNNGKNELIFGGDDKTLKIFDNINSEEPRLTLYYDSWVTSCAIGLLKLPQFKRSINGLIVGTKNGGLQLVQLNDNKPDIIWQRDLSVRINDIAIGDVTNDGYNEIILGTNDSYIKILNSEGKNLRYINVRNGRSISSSRPLTLFVDDIDGDGANEIIAGCANGSLKVYHNPELNSINFKLKWKTKTKTSIEDICTIDDDENGITNIIYGGYDRAIRQITDFQYGKKPTLDVPLKIKPPIRRKKSQSAKKVEKEPIPTNIREHILKILKEKKLLATIDLFIKELVDLGYSREVVTEEIEKMKLGKLLRYEPLNISVWSLPDEIDEIKEKPKVKVKPSTVKKAIVGEKRQVNEEPEKLSNELEDCIIKFLQKKKVITTKSDFVNSIMKFDFKKEEIEEQIEILKKEKRIIYSKTDPRGWKLSEE